MARDLSDTRLHFDADPLVYQKQIYLTNKYVSSTDVLLETQLPLIEKFHSKMTDEDDNTNER